MLLHGVCVYFWTTMRARFRKISCLHTSSATLTSCSSCVRRHESPQRNIANYFIYFPRLPICLIWSGQLWHTLRDESEKFFAPRTRAAVSMSNQAAFANCCTERYLIMCHPQENSLHYLSAYNVKIFRLRQIAQQVSLSVNCWGGSAGKRARQKEQNQ